MLADDCHLFSIIWVSKVELIVTAGALQLLITALKHYYFRKALLKNVHYFVHLNLALSLLLANVVFAGGSYTAVGNEV